MSSKPVEWTFDDEGNIHFTVTSNGMTCEQWEHHLKSRRLLLDDSGPNLLRHVGGVSTNGVVYRIVVRPGSKIADRERTIPKVFAHAANKGWKIPHWEVACLISDTFSNEQVEQMGLFWITIMHKPIYLGPKHPEDQLFQFICSCGGMLTSIYNFPHDELDSTGGFAFQVP